MKKRYLLSINHGLSTDLARLLKQETIEAKDLRIGDVVVDDYNVWQVASLVDNGDGSVEILDSYDNGGRYNGSHEFDIISRSCLVDDADVPRFI